MSSVKMSTVARLKDLKNRVERLNRDAEDAVSNINSVLTRGDSVYKHQESIQDRELFFRSYPNALQEIDKLVNCMVKLNCELEISLERKSPLLDKVKEFEINNAEHEIVCNCGQLCETCSKEKMTISTSTCESSQGTLDTDSDFCILTWDTVGTNTDLIAFTQETVGTNTDINTLSGDSVGVNTNLTTAADAVVTSTDFNEQAQETTSKMGEYAEEHICKIQVAK